MAWYKTGNVSVVNGETSITGSDTKFASNSRVGDGFRGPDGQWYEIVNIASETVLGIYPGYRGTTTANSTDYMIAPLQGYNKESADRLRAITDSLAGVTVEVQDLVDEAKASQVAAKTSETNSKASELAAKSSENTSTTNANTTTANAADALASKNSAAASEAKAKQWATAGEGVQVEPGLYSALAWAKNSEFNSNAAQGYANDAKASADSIKSITISPFIEPFTAKGDGVTNDTAAFTTFENTYKGLTVDLNGKTVLVTSVPSKNAYVNGKFKIGSFTKPATDFNTYLANPVYHNFYGGQLSELREMLLNPLAQFIGVVFIGDSITWGSGTGENSTFDPRTGFLSDPRDFGSTPNMPNLFRDLIVKSYGRSASVNFTNWSTSPTGECIATVTFPERIQTMWNGMFTITSGGSGANATEVYEASLKTGKRVNLTNGNAALDIGHTVSWRFTGSTFNLYLSAVDANATNYEIFVNGVSQGVRSTATADNPGWVNNTNGNLHVWSFGYVTNALIELKTRRLGATGNRVLYLDGIGVTKVLRITNQGINGASSDSYRIRNLVSGDNMAVRSDDRYCFIQTGTNDRIKGTLGGSENDVQQRYAAMLAAIPATTQKILMCAGPAENEDPATYYTDMSEIRDMIIRTAKSQSLDFIDNYTALRRNDPRAWSNDGLHPTGLGYTVIAKNIFNALEVSYSPGKTGVLTIAEGGTGATTANGARTALGLGNVDNTSDASKPVSTAQQTALDQKLSTTGNAASATKLATARNINGIPFDGTAAISIGPDSTTSALLTTHTNQIADLNTKAVITRKWTGSAVTPTAGTPMTVTHNLGVQAQIVKVKGTMLTTAGGYSAGDIIDFGNCPVTLNGSLSFNYTFYNHGVNSFTAILGASGFALNNKTTGSVTSLTPAQISITFEVFA